MPAYSLVTRARCRPAAALMLALLASWLPSPGAAADFVNHIGMAFVTVPSGGVRVDGVEVRLSHPLQVGVVPVTDRQLRRFRTAQLKPDRAPAGQGTASPASGVTWIEAQAFVAWLNATKPAADRGRYRLLSEAEWVYAARAGGTGEYPWGDAVTKGLCPSCGGKFDPQAPAGRTAANRFGLRDMVGGNWEWTADCWQDPGTSVAASRPADGSPMPGPADCDRVLHGGRDLNLGAEPDDPLPVDARHHADPFYGSDMLSFRVARALPADHRDPRRREVGVLPDAGRFMPPVTAPVALFDQPTAEGVNAAILALLTACGPGLTYDTTPIVVSDVIEKTHPVFRGLPVLRWDTADAGEGSSWGPVFGATVRAVVAAIPESATPAKFLHRLGEGRVVRSVIELSAGETWLICQRPNSLHYD